MSGEWRNGRPRVAGPYDTSEKIREVLADMHKDGTAQGGDEFALLDRESGRHSGFLQRLATDYFTTGSIPVKLKNVTQSEFRPGIEDTKMWGDTFSGDFTPANGLPGPLLGPPTPVLNVKINRQRPTTFNLLSNVVLLGSVWGLETTPSFVTFIYTIGVGQQQTQVLRFVKFTPSTMDSLTTVRNALDVFTTPLQSLVVTAFMFLPVLNANIAIDHQFQVSVLASPEVT